MLPLASSEESDRETAFALVVTVAVWSGVDVEGLLYIVGPFHASELTHLKCEVRLYVAEKRI